MFDLVATIFLNAILFIFFKIFSRYGVNNLQAIVINYWTCAITGSILLGSFPVSIASVHQPWLPWAVLMGSMFFMVFNLLAYSTLKDGITTTTVANKLSMVIPVVFSVFLYDEQLGAIKILGILLAFPAVYLTTRVKEDGEKGQELLWPALIFIGSGLLDTMVKYIEHTYISSAEQLVDFTIHVFTTAGVAGAIVVSVQVLRGKIKLHFKNVVAGVILGVPNYFSIYYFIRFLRSGFLHSSAGIPVTNVGIVLVSALAAILFFKEKAPGLRVVGLVLSIIAILLIALGDMNGTV